MARKRIPRRLEKLTADEIADAVSRNVFSYRTFVCIPNLHWQLVRWEMDLGVVNTTGYLYEVEIKVSASDLRADRLKKKWHDPLFNEMIRKYYVAVPLGMIRLAESVLPPEHGIISTEGRDTGYWSRIVREARMNKGARKLTPDEIVGLYRGAYYRYWDRRNEAALISRSLHRVIAERMSAVERDT